MQNKQKKNIKNFKLNRIMKVVVQEEEECKMIRKAVYPKRQRDVYNK